MSLQVSTRILVISDTHGASLARQVADPVDVIIHSGDLTEESKLDEYKESIRLLKSLNSPLKLVIAGNHDFTLDTPVFEQKLIEAHLKPPHEDETVKLTYGGFGEARALLDSQKDAGIIFLDEGNHEFELTNGAMLRVYASPYTPSKHGGWGYCYDPDQGHDWNIGKDVDITITHGPPRGIFDYTHDKQRAGCPDLFAAVAKARPLMHCFGHIHEAWGAKQITWRGADPSEHPSHSTDIDNDNSKLVESLATLRPGKFDSPGRAAQKAERLAVLTRRGYCFTAPALQRGIQTLFVNAAIEGDEPERQQLPWLVQLNLPTAKK